MNTIDALGMAIEHLAEEKAGYRIAVKTSKSLPASKLPPLVRRHRLKYQQLDNAIIELSKLQRRLRKEPLNENIHQTGDLESIPPVKTPDAI